MYAGVTGSALCLAVVCRLRYVLYLAPPFNNLLKGLQHTLQLLAACCRWIAVRWGIKQAVWMVIELVGWSAWSWSS